MQANKTVQIILIILCALLVLASCAPTQPQGTLEQQNAETPTQSPSPTSANNTQATVTISIDCRTATRAGVPGAPENGWIISEEVAVLQDGDTVWDVVSRVCKDKGIAVSKIGSGASIFVKAIDGVAPIGAQSGWMFSVDGEYILSSAGNITLNGGEIIRWVYTMDGGDDL